MPSSIQKIRIARTERLTLGSLKSAERERLVTRLHGIYCAYLSGVDRAAFECAYFTNDQTRIGLFYGADEVLAGFSTATILRIEHDGREYAVFSAPVIIDTRYRGGGTASAIFGLTEALRVKLRHPTTPLAYLSVTISPAAYKLFVDTMPRVYPSRFSPIPPEIAPLIVRVAQLRSLPFEDQNKWLVRASGVPTNPEQAKNAASLRGDPDVAFFLEQNPHLHEGVSMLVWMPLDFSDIAGALWRALRAQPKRSRRTAADERTKPASYSGTMRNAGE